MKQVTISGLTVREAQVALLDAVNEGVLEHISVFNEGSTRASFNGGGFAATIIPDGDDIIMESYHTVESDPTAWRVTEGILRLAAAAKRNGGGK